MVGMSTGETWTLGRRPALDGLRGVACALVVVAHAHVPGLELAGAVGVAMFFTLSGFLITSLLLEERTRHGRIALGAFYGRRALRLAPALIACVTVVALMLGPLGLVTWGQTVAALAYAFNWLAVHEGAVGALGHTWSLAIEEQFYLTWPLLVAVLAGRRRLLLSLASVGAVAALALRVAWWDGGAGIDRIHYGFDTSADALLVGCGLAVLMHRTAERAPRRAVAGAALVAAVAVCLGGPWVMFVPGPTLVALLTAAAIYVLTQRGDVGWLQHRWLRLVGQRSYGLYLWHYPVAALLGGQEWPVRLLVVSGVGWGLALLSWRYVEQPFLRRRAPLSAVDCEDHRPPHAASVGAAHGGRGVAVTHV